MTSQVTPIRPTIGQSEVRDIVEDEYGLQVACVTELDSYVDRNFLVTVKRGCGDEKNHHHHHQYHHTHSSHHQHHDHHHHNISYDEEKFVLKVVNSMDSHNGHVGMKRKKKPFRFCPPPPYEFLDTRLLYNILIYIDYHKTKPAMCYA